jgi:uncharacterized membrane protein
MNKNNIIRKSIMIIIILLSIIISIIYYPQIPEKVASHWDASGEVNGYMSKFWGVFLMPIVLIGMFVLFSIIPLVDPLKKNIQKFREYFDWFVIIILLFMFLVHVQIILWNIGIQIDMNITMPIGIAIMFYYIGVLCEKSKRNWSIGIRTPWTLSSDTVWDKTNKLGGKLFKIAAVLALIGIFFGQYSLYFILIPALGAALTSTIYSYIIFKKTKKK